MSSDKGNETSQSLPNPSFPFNILPPYSALLLLGMASKSRLRLDSHRGPISRTSSTYVRKRATKACQVCRARRTKCDQQRPACSFCVKAGVECVFDLDERATFDQASLAIIDRLDRLERKIDAQSQSVMLDIPGQTLPRNQINQNLFFFPCTVDKVLQWDVFRDASSPNLTASTQQSLASQPQGGNDNAETSWVGDILDRTLCDRWLDNFFAHIHVKNPILDETETRRLVSRLCARGLDWDVESGLALLVCANGAIARPLQETLPFSHSDRRMAISLLSAAQRRLGGGLGPTGLIQAQCAFLSGVLLMSLMRPVEAWTTFVHGLAICQTFACTQQRDHDVGQMGSREASEQSVLWACWKSEQELRLELGMSNFTCLADDPPELFPNPPEGCEGHVEQAWYFYLSEIALWRLEVNARRLMTQIQHEDWPSVSKSISEIGQDASDQLETWKTTLPPLVSIHQGAEDDVIRFVLRGRITYIHELVSWPFIHVALNRIAECDLAEHETAAALSFHYDRLLVNEPGYYHRHHGTWLMLRTSARSACILLGFSRMYPGSSLLPSGWKNTVLGTLKMVEYWSNEAEGMLSVLQSMTWLFQTVQ
ncbi:Zn2-C6 fungal-type DNA-binding domain [Fusarium oxysporum f. sp. vasinfectum]|nr:Zn2-C6 fungal-type DNA-binding domain [Fusarium oxysporum f. sp. vasinfectum]